MRRVILAGLALVAAVTVFEIPTANAQVSNGRNPWCLRDGAMGQGNWDCSYQTLQQCRLTSNYDSDGFCTQNPNYRGGREGTNRQDNSGTWGWGGASRR